MCKKKEGEETKYERKYCLCCLPLRFAIIFFTFVFSCDWIGALVNLVKSDVVNLASTTFWFLLKTNLITSFIMVWSYQHALEAREILLRSFIAQYMCEVVYFITYYIYMAASDDLTNQCDRFYTSPDLDFDLETIVTLHDCRRFFKTSWLSLAGIGFICVYTPIRAYALRNIYYFKEELKHQLEVE